MPFHLPITNLNGGELSHFLDARVDIAKYNTGLQQLTNFLVTPYGAILRRPGTEFEGEAKYHDRRCRLFGFNFSTTTNFILEVGRFYCRFWSNGVPVIKGSADAWLTATAYEVGDYVTSSMIMYYCIAAHTSAAAFATDLAASKWVEQDILEVPLPYGESDLRDIQFCPINDIIYLTHPNYFVYKIKRWADDYWTSERVSWDVPPTLDENIEQLTITPSATTGTITLTASAALWKDGHVGSTWLIAHRRSGDGHSYVQVVLDATTRVTGSLSVLGTWEFTTYGSWQGQVRIDRQVLGTTVWEPIRTYENTVVGQRNVTTTGTEEKECYLRILWTTAGIAGTNPLGRIEVGESKYYGIVEIMAGITPTVANAFVHKTLWSTTATIFWAEAAFSDEQGHPRTVALHEGRLVFGGTRKQPLRLYGSFTDDYENFRVGSNADNAIAFRISANESNPIQWLISQQGKLIIGTAAEEIEFGRSDDNDALSPTNVRAIRQSSYGSSHVQAKLVNEVIMFVQRQGKKLREFVFAFEKDGWVGPDLTVLANQISGVRSKIAELAFQQQPDATLWAVVTGGAHIASMTYERDQNVAAWSRQTTEGGVFESAATIYGGDDPDEVWFAVKRTVNGATKRYIERMHSDHRDELDAEDKANFWYLDSAKKGVFADLTPSVSGLDHLEGMTVGVYADGGRQPDRVVTSGGITLETPARNILVGLRYTSVAKPQKFNIPSQDGSVIGRKGRVHIATVRIYKSLGMEYSSDDENWTEVTFRKDGDAMDASPSMVTGDQRIIVDGGYDSSAQLSLRSSEPFPLCILAIIPEVEYHGT